MITFSKDKMIARVKAEGKGDMLDQPTLAMMDMLDGLEAHPNRWRQTVHGEENAYYCELDGKQIPVNLLDCNGY